MAMVQIEAHVQTTCRPAVAVDLAGESAVAIWWETAAVGWTAR